MNPINAADALAKQLLHAVRRGGHTDLLCQQLAQIPVALLAGQLSDQATRKAFLLNLYNAFVQLALLRNPDSYQDKGRFFGRPLLQLAGNHLSLDDLEHGLLRGSQWKWGMGYVRKPFVSAFEQRFRLSGPDPRLHFALNCGAASCPPIGVYDAANLEQQLNLATTSYLQQEVRYDAGKNTVYLPKLFLWFRGDFGGGRGIRQLLARQGLIPAGSDPRFRYRSYNWSLQTGKYQ